MLASVVLSALVQSGAAAQQIEVGIIDFYGLGQLSEAAVRQALTVKEGDTIAVASGVRPPVLEEMERRLTSVAGVARARTSLVCCEDGRAILYVGIEGTAAKRQQFLPTPTGAVRLPAPIVELGRTYEAAILDAAQRGALREDDSRGYALFDDPAARAIQERFVGIAAAEQAVLRRVLRESADADQRALAAHILSYSPDKDAVVPDLVRAMRDPSEDVRNDAMRGLAVFANASPGARPTRPIAYDGFVAMLNSPVWTDRNKASLALLRLSKDRDPRLLDRLRRDAMTPLVEMAGWKSVGHASPALMLLARIANLPDEVAAKAAASPEDRQALLDAARKRDVDKRR